MTTGQTLQQALESMARVNESQARQIEELTRQVKELTSRIAWFTRQMYGRKSEKHLNLENQPSLFGEDELDAVTESPAGQGDGDGCAETEVLKATARRKYVKRLRQTWENLPVLETRTIEPKGIDLNRYRKIGEEVTYQVAYESGRIYRVAIIRPKYGLIDPTEPVERGEGVKIAPMPLLPINKGIPAASLLAEVLLQKYEYHMPFYRQIKQFAHLGMTGLKESTVTGWFRQTMELLRPLHNALVKEVFGSDYIQADEEYLWMARAVMERLVAFFYDNGSRAGNVIKDKTDEHNFKCYLQCDGFGGYTAAFKPGFGVTLVNCLVHIRRAFEKALDGNRKGATWCSS